MRNLLGLLWDEWKDLEPQIEEMNDEVEQIARATDAGCCRIRQIPGIGPLVATAIVAAIGNGAAFRKGREFAAWLGLVPRQYSTGGKASSGHQQARQHLPAQDPDPWSPRGRVAIEARSDRDRSVDDRS